MLLKDIQDDEPRYSSESDYKDKQKSKGELAHKWKSNIEAGWRVKRAWMNRFSIEKLYQFYEGYQWQPDTTDQDRPFVVNMIFASIETKLPGLLFQNPTFALRPKPISDNWDFDAEVKTCQDREDGLNFVCSRAEFGLVDKHELCVLDAFFGFGVIEVDHSKDRLGNPYINKGDKNPLNNLYCKQIPFDHFLVSANANWDLSEGKWWGYYEFVPRERMTEYKGITLEDPAWNIEDGDFAAGFNENGKIIIDNPWDEYVPKHHFKVYHIWDFEEGKKISFCESGKMLGDKILKVTDFDYCPISVLRFGKRRKGWYPLPPVFNWISPQEEINDIRQAQRIHRKRFTRKYTIQGEVDEEEIEKLLYGPDGTIIKTKPGQTLAAIQDAPLDNSNTQSLAVSYDDFNRVSGTGSELQGPSDRETATAAGIKAKRSQIRDSKDQMRVATFLNEFARNTLRAIRKTGGKFWAATSVGEHLMGELKNVNKQWKQIPASIFGRDDYDIDVNVSSISPVYAQQDKTAFMEFLAVITQYEILAFSPALLREAAYRVGYRNSTVLNQFQQLAQLAALGRQLQLKGQVQAMNAQLNGIVPGQNGPQPTSPGDLAQNQVSASTPPTNEALMNMIFNKNGVQQAQ